MVSRLNHQAIINSRRLPLVWSIFLLVYLFFYFTPSLIILLNIDENHILPELVNDRLTSFNLTPNMIADYQLASFLFLGAYVLPSLLRFLIRKKKNNKQQLNKIEKYDVILDITFNNKHLLSKLIEQLISIMAFLGSIIVILYFFTVGYSFLALLGTDISNADFRFTLYADENQFINYLLELARRVLLPIGTAYFMFRSNIIYGKLRIRDKFLWCMLLFSGLMTLDRGPIFISIVLLGIYSIWKSHSLVNAFFKILSWGLAIIIIGGSTTYLQYNEIDFDFIAAFFQGISFVLTRVFFDPALSSLTYSFSVIDGNTNPLLLSFSRVSVLWGNDYIGTFGEAAKYVTPVSIVGDIWRNFGMIGIVIVSFVFSTILLSISTKQESVVILFKFPIMFLSIILSFYLIAGNLFSLGPMLILFLIWSLAQLTTINWKRVKYLEIKSSRNKI